MKINQQKWPHFLSDHIVFLLFVGQIEDCLLYVLTDGREGRRNERGFYSIESLKLKLYLENTQLHADITIFDTP
jgi:hypothetical protein